MTIIIRAWMSPSSYPMTRKYEYATFGDGDLASVKRQALAIYGSDCQIHIYSEFGDYINPIAIKEHNHIRFKNV